MYIYVNMKLTKYKTINICNVAVMCKKILDQSQTDVLEKLQVDLSA